MNLKQTQRKAVILYSGLSYLSAFRLYKELRSNRPDLSFNFRPAGNAGLYQVELER